MHGKQSLGRMVFLVAVQMCLVATAGSAAAERFIVKDGEARARIVIAPERARMVSLAALELQHYIEKISGARLPIGTEPGEGVVNIYVGRSAETERLGIDDEGLQYGAFRMVSGSDGLVLLGRDFDYEPPRPYPATRNEIEAAVKEWDALTADYTDSAWELPWRTAFKSWWNPRNFDEIMAERYGAENKPVWNPGDLTWARDYYAEGERTGYWKSDQGGSLNAVYGYLRGLGVRWYMPGELGEVVPAKATIALPEVNRTVKPDFAMRSWFWYNYSGFPLDHTIWARRLGMNSSHEVLGNIGHAHGLTIVHGREEMQTKHPEYYALYGGERDTKHRGHGTACHSSEGLEKDAIAFARFMFDHYDAPHISLFPSDGFKICGCEKCAGKSASELVWGFVDRIARELYKTHPDRIVSCGAYTSYVHPPEHIERFTPNVAVLICNRGRPLLGDPVKWDAYWSQIESWREKLGPRRLMRVENNRYTLNNGKPIAFPALHPRAMAKDLRALNGICLGEYNEESQSRARWKAPGCDHLNLYVNARFLWDADQDIDAMLEEYHALFYGPVAAEMQEAFTQAEADFVRLRLGASSSLRQARIDRMQASVDFSDRLHRALSKVGSASVYGKRIQFILDELVPLETLRAELETALNAPDPRADASVIVARDTAAGGEAETYALGDMATGETPENPTTFRVTWDDGALVFDIRCTDKDMPNLFVTDDVWGGDSVSILLESPVHSYYQIEVNPEGTIFDSDRKGGRVDRWESQAEVTTERDQDAWRAIVRIPVMAPEENEGDPYHYVVGPKPSAENPWYVNVGRAYVRPDSRSGQAFAPTGGTYHNREKFAKLVVE